MNKKQLWTGIGIGVAVGFTGGFIVGNQVTKRAARKDIAARQHDAYLKGKKDGQKEVEAECIVIDSESDIKKMIDEHFSEAEKTKATPEKETKKNSDKPRSEPISEKRASVSKSKAEKSSLNAKSDDAIYAQNGPIVGDKRFRTEGNHIVFIGAAGTELYYPMSLVFDKLTGEMWPETRIRENFRGYESDAHKLMVVWSAMGWGIYTPYSKDSNNIPESETPDQVQTMEDINNMDLSIGDESLFGDEETRYGDEPEEKTEERRKYMADLNNPNKGPKIITRKEFEEESYLEHTNFDYFAVDNVFIENTDLHKDIGALELFGTNDGKELFAHKVFTEDDEDPDIVYVKNVRMGFVAEITRYKKSYASMMDGTAFLETGGGQ